MYPIKDGQMMFGAQSIDVLRASDYIIDKARVWSIISID